MTKMTVTALHLEPRHFVPNNARLPALIYEGAFDANAADLATLMEKRFRENGWPPQWRDGIYDFDHYHSQGHEVLGIAAGSATIILGGTGRREIEGRSEDFLVVGAYPPGQAGDIVREDATPAMLQKIALLSFPPRDPVVGDDGPLLRLWVDVTVA